ncbi:MAG: NUDIX hydrolase [Spirochaetes bacterium]|nr:NUDIX hydrolase [Spirochaetota bacterium]
MKGIKFCPYCASPIEKRDIDGRQRAACPSRDCGFVHWDNPVPIVAAIIEHVDGIVLARNAGWPENMFGLVTGFLEKGEHPDQGVLREVREELGLDSSIVEFLGNFSFFEANQILIAYHVKASGEIRTSDEIAEVKLVPAEKLKSWPFGTGRVVKAWLEKRQGGSSC